MAVAQVRDVAARAGVSPATVSNALNRPEKVSPTTLARIQAAIDELGYVRNEAARQLRMGSNLAIGMVVLDVANPFFTDVAAGVESTLSAHKRPLILANSDQDATREADYLDLFEQQRLSGVLITPVTADLDRLRRLRDRGISVVLVDRFSKAKEFSSVSVDDRLGGRLAAEHLLDTGRRRLTFIGGPAGLSQIKDRLAATRTAVDAVDGASVSYIETRAMNVEAGRQGAAQVLASANRPDAIFAANDLVALGVLQSLTLAGVSVPDDIALIGYDDVQFAGAAAIPLSSIRQPAQEMGATATDLLLDVIADPEASVVKHVRLKPELVVRRSTGG